MRFTPTTAAVAGPSVPAVPANDRQDVADGRRRDQGQGDRRRDDERGAADDEREGEEERAGGAAGEGHEQGRHGDRHRALDDELGGAQGVGREQVVDDDHEQSGEREQDEDRRLRLGPQPGRGHDDGRGQEEDPGDDPDDAVVGLGRDAVIGRGSLDPTDDRRLGRASLIGRRRAGLAGERARPPEQGREQDHGHHEQVRDDGDDDEEDDRLDRQCHPR